MFQKYHVYTWPYVSSLFNCVLISSLEWCLIRFAYCSLSPTQVLQNTKILKEMSCEHGRIKQIKNTKWITLPTKGISVCYFGQLDCLGSLVDSESHFHVIVSLQPKAKLQLNTFVNKPYITPSSLFSIFDSSLQHNWTFLKLTCFIKPLCISFHLFVTCFLNYC